jgi:hypothetical protein
MKVLVACEQSGVVRNAFMALGHDAYSCDLLPSDDNSYCHVVRDAVEMIWSCSWDLVIAHPPCTYLCSSGLHWNKRIEGRQQLTSDACEFFMQFTKLPCAWAIENPIGCMSRIYRKPDQIIQPYQFGHDASKSTCLWLNHLPMLYHTKYIEPRIVGGKRRWGNQLDSGQNRLSPSANRWKIRSKTFQGIADAMARQWG